MSPCWSASDLLQELWTCVQLGEATRCKVAQHVPGKSHTSDSTFRAGFQSFIDHLE